MAELISSSTVFLNPSLPFIDDSAATCWGEFLLWNFWCADAVFFLASAAPRTPHPPPTFSRRREPPFATSCSAGKPLVCRRRPLYFFFRSEILRSTHVVRCRPLFEGVFLVPHPESGSGFRIGLTHPSSDLPPFSQSPRPAGSCKLQCPPATP